jgi:DNA-binding CsgD family transcriptional regulator
MNEHDIDNNLDGSSDDFAPIEESIQQIEDRFKPRWEEDTRAAVKALLARLENGQHTDDWSSQGDDIPDGIEGAIWASLIYHIERIQLVFSICMGTFENQRGEKVDATTRDAVGWLFWEFVIYVSTEETASRYLGWQEGYKDALEDIPAAMESLEVGEFSQLKEDQQRVVCLIRSGMTHSEVAAKIHCSVANVRYHLGEAAKTLGITRRELTNRLRARSASE